MTLSFSRRLFGAAVIVLSLAAQGASAAQPIIVHKVPSPDCQKKSVDDPKPNAAIPHQYMVLLVFKRHSGRKYFGKATPLEYGCIQDVDTVVDPASGRKVVTAAKTDLTVENCPNDCVYPYGDRPKTDDGDDPLNVDPKHTNVWGILSAVNSAPLSGGKKRHIEIWQIAVRDACHARKLYAYHTKHHHSLLSRALRHHHMLGEILVGYRVHDNGNAQSTPCE